MATLRNKTTERGSIIWWKPHPDHTRPSTYQVEPSALSLLREMGYEAPDAGDEIEVPWQVCRPLRILGDLHFEDEQPGKVDTSDITMPTGSVGSPLSERERELLREYIQTHPRYEPETRRQLSIDGADGSSDTQPAVHGDEGAESTATDDFTGPGIIPDTGISVGTIHRYSNNSNAMFAPEEGSKERNVGDLPRSLKGEWTICADYAGDNIGLCLTPQLWTSSYRKMVRRNVDELADRTGFGSLRPLLNIRDRADPAELGEDPVSVRVAIAKDGFGIGYKGPWTVVVLGELVTSGTRIDVQIIDRYDHVVIARPAITAEDDELAAGDVLLVGVEEVQRDRIVGTYQSRYVEVPNSGYAPGNRIRIGLQDVSPSQITGTVTALDRSERPEEGDVVTVQDHTLVDYPYVPVAVPDDLPETDRELQLGVVSVDTAGVSLSCRARRDNYQRSVGDRLVHEFGPEECLDTWFVDDGMPINIEGTTPYPGIPIELEIIDFDDGYVCAEAVRHAVDSGTDDNFRSLVATGTDRLADGQRNAALEHFVRATEVATTPADAGTSRTMATIVACDQILHHQGPETAHRYCVSAGKSLCSTPPSLDSALENHVEGLQHILRAAWLVKRANEATEKLEATRHRADAKEALVDGIEMLRASDITSVEGEPRAVFEIVDRIVDEVSDDILSLPTSVKDYRD